MKAYPKDIQIIRLVTAAGREHHLCEITYVKKSQFAVKPELVTRKIAPYEIDSKKYIMATDNKDGENKIKSFLIRNIEAIKVLADTFTPVWEVKL